MKTTLLYLIFICSFIVVSGAAPSNKPVNSAQKDEKRINVVVIDPGHGGKDYGASVGNAKEKDIVLDLAMKLGKSINATYPDIKVIYTRTKDVFIPLYDRAKIANKNKADIFISIHVNGTDKTSVQGTETFVLGEHRSKDNFEVMKKENSVILLEDDYITTYEGFDPHSSESEIMFANAQSEYLDQSIMFASEIQYQFRQNAKRIDRSVKQAGFLVLRMVAMPSVLIEVGFISHPNERNYMLSEPGKSALSTSIFNAFKDYKKKIENKSNFVVHSEKNHSPVATADTNINTEPSEIVNKPAVSKTNTAPNSGNIHFSVQIAASKKKMETSPSNFKGEKNIFRIESKDMSRYYTGKYNNYEDAVNEKQRIEKKFPEAFVVAFENNEIISVKKALEKM